MSKPTVLPSPRKAQHGVVQLEPRTAGHRHAGRTLKYHPVLIELSRATASLWLLNQIEGGHVEPPDADTLRWVRSMVLDQIEDALKIAHAEFVKAAELHQAAL